MGTTENIRLFGKLICFQHDLKVLNTHKLNNKKKNGKETPSGNLFRH